MQSPNITYIISSQLFEKTKNYELLLAIPDEDNEECDGIIILNDEKKGKLDGSNIKFTEKNIVVDNKNTYTFNELAIVLEDEECYLIIVSTKEKIWNLPNEVISFLKMDLVKINYALTIINQKPYIIEVSTRNTIGINQKINWNKELTLSTNDKDNIVDFYYKESNNDREALDLSYFMKHNSKYYFKDCYLSKYDNKIGVFSDTKIDNEISKYNSSLLGFVNI